MTETLAAALLLNFGATVGVMIARAGPLNQSPVTYQLTGPLIVLGAFGGFLCLYLFYRDEGLLYGFLYWLLSGIGFAAIAGRLISGWSYPIRSYFLCLAYCGFREVPIGW